MHLYVIVLFTLLIDQRILARMTLFFRELAPNDAAEIVEVSRASFEHFVARDWSDNANDEYRGLLVTQSLAGKITGCAYSVAAVEQQRIVGFLLMPRANLIQMFFVLPALVRNGIGRQLWLHARTSISQRFPDVATIEVNASPFAVEFYRALGFVAISREFQSNGFRATRMACWLKAHALGAEL